MPRTRRIDPATQLAILRLVCDRNAEAEIRNGKPEEPARRTGRWFAEQRTFGDFRLKLRNGRPWYRMPGRGLAKIYDAIEKF